ncbi:MAG: CPBP family glutamic-type intramembrane protease [Candidatus Freyarchaeota archaeon]
MTLREKLDAVRDVSSVIIPSLLFIHFRNDQKMVNSIFFYLILAATPSIVGSLTVSSYLKFKLKSFVTAFVTAVSMFFLALFASSLVGYRAVPTFATNVEFRPGFYMGLFAYLVGYGEESGFRMLYLMLRLYFNNFFFASTVSGLLFAWAHVPAYCGVDFLDVGGIIASGRAPMLIAPFLVNYIICWLIDWEGGIMGAVIGHGTFDAYAFGALKSLLSYCRVVAC